ncbi:hypothetical protein C4J81_17310 [Deltaproteobacteria bacterium Smac51]|nr:hypothetical protein C4J81_17310 [Deltaproteobacteria bacterium Smac51]
MKKLGIIGAAGGLGSTMAFYLGLKDIFEEIALFDIKDNVLQTHVIDLTECFSAECATRVTWGGWEVLTGCDLVIMAASLAGHRVKSRNEYLEANLKIVLEAAGNIKKYCPGTTLVSVTAPVDVYAYVFSRELGDKHRVMGFCRNDSQRFRWAVSQVTGLDGRRIGGLVLGEHGETQVPVFSTVTVDGREAGLSEVQKSEITRILRDWYPRWQSLDSGRTTTWTSATSMLAMLASLAGGCQDGPTMGSVVLEGEYGLSAVSLGVPIIADEKGWKEVVEIELTGQEQEALGRSAEHVKGLIAQCL